MIGDRLGKWVIFKELGRGGMGRVYLAQEEIGGRQAAIKVLAAELSQETGFLKRFQREIETLSELTHPNIVQFYESGKEDDHYFYAMEYVDGQSLEEVLLDRKKLSWSEVLDITIQICAALRHVHNHGVIHRDIKPSNILVKSDGTAKLTDFGIVKVFASRHLTATGSVVGTAEFLSPEQAAGKPITKRSDLYSLGVMIYMMLTGRPPFEGDTMLDLLHKHRYAQFDAPSKLVPNLPYEIDEVVCQLLEKEPDKRPGDCYVLAKQLERIKRKLERRKLQTEAEALRETIAVQKEDAEYEDAPGPATLMSRLMRKELDAMNRKGPISQFLNRAWVLLILITLCIGVLVWTFWPLDADAMFERGSELMQKNDPAKWEQAWDQYFKPLNENFPDHPYKKKLEKYRRQIDEARIAAATPSEAKRLFEKGQRYHDAGEWAKAKQSWQTVIVIFDSWESEKRWVKDAEKAIEKLDATAGGKTRLDQIRKMLDQAAQANDGGRMWATVVALYRNDPWAKDVVNAAAAKWGKGLNQR